MDELLWLSGLLEGEGYFALSRHSGGSVTLRVILEMSDRDVVERAARTISGATAVKIKTLPNRKDTWTVHWHGAAAAELMWAVLPNMGQRRTEQILTAMADWLEYKMSVCRMCGLEFSAKHKRIKECGETCRRRYIQSYRRNYKAEKARADV